MFSTSAWAPIGQNDHYEAPPYQTLLWDLETGVRVYLGIRAIEPTEDTQFNCVSNVANAVNEVLFEFRTLAPSFVRDSMSASDILSMLDGFVVVREQCKEDLKIGEESLKVIDFAIAAILEEL